MDDLNAIPSCAAQFEKSALVIAHPGHELRVLGWLEQFRPTTYVLTDGSGRSGQSRLKSTSRLLDEAGALPGSMYGRFTDRTIYQAVLNVQWELFCRFADELADALVRQEVEFVLGDAAEGEFMTHDLWREVRRAAVAQAEEALGRPISQFEFAVDTHPHNCPPDLRPQAIRIELDRRQLDRKVQAARDYVQIRDIVDASLTQFGRDAFGTEWLFPCSEQSLLSPESLVKPCYERAGERSVADGVYPAVVRYREHLLPIFRALKTPLAEAA